MPRSVRRALALLGIAATSLVIAAPAYAEGPHLFVPGTTATATAVTFPLHEGRGPDGRATWFIVIEASNSAAATNWHVNVVNKLNNVGDGAQRATVVGGLLTFEGGVDFAPARSVAGTPGTGFPPAPGLAGPPGPGFPPVPAEPGSIGDASYSPIARLPDGSVLNAPQIAN